MTYEKAVKRAEVLNRLTINENMTYVARIYDNNPNDSYVLQYYKGQPAGVAAY